MAEGLSTLTGRRKAAILLVSLGPEGAAQVFQKLSDDMIEKLTIEMARTRDVSADEAEGVQREAIENAVARGYVADGGIAFARDVLERAMGDQRAGEILSRLATVIEQTPFEFLRDTPADQIVAFLRGEHSQTLALVIANLPSTELAAKVMQLMSPEEQAEVATRIALMDKTSPDVIRDIANVLREKLQMVFQQEYAAAGGVQALADILNAADRGTERNILEHLEQENTDLANEVRSMLFTFDDLLQLDERSVQLVLKGIDTKDLALALRGAGEEVREWIFANLSDRASEMLREELELMPPQRRRVVEEAQSKVVAAVRQLEDAGEIVIARGGATDDELIS
jgi:flagellar motor switch protein FliG